jgi:hypothetical protein
MENSTSGQQSLKALTSWVETCDSGINHPHCTGLRDRVTRTAAAAGHGVFLPTRLLYVGSKSDPCVRLLADTRSVGVRGPYTTLRFEERS